jgi:hypothetical protein
MYGMRDALGLIAALVCVAALLWFGVGHFNASTASGGKTPAPGASVADHAAVIAYLHHLSRIDAPVEAYERQSGQILHSELTQAGPLTDAARQRLRSIASAYSSAAAEVRHVDARPGFENAQRLLAKTYDDQAAVYRGILLLANGKTVQSDPNAVLDELKRIDRALGAFNSDLTGCRAAFEQATTAGGVTDPAWVAALINHATGKPSTAG